MIPLINMQLGEIIVGGVGAGLYGMLLFVILAVFVAGLMVGRTPEYVGKKIEAQGSQDGDAGHPDPAADVSSAGRLWPGSIRRRRLDGKCRARMASRGPLRLQVADRQQWLAFGGLTGNTLFYNLTGAVSMLVGRFG